MNLTLIRRGLANHFSDITGLRVFPDWPDSVIVPCACIVFDGDEDDQTFGNEYVILTHLRIDILVSVQPDSSHAQQRLDAIMGEPTRDAIRAASAAAAAAADAALSTYGDASVYKFAGTSGLREMVVGGVSYLGVEVSVDVWARHS